VAGDIGLIGGDEFRRGCEDMDREIMRASDQDPAQVLIVPTAALDAPGRAADNGVRHFGAQGADARRLMILEKAHADDAGLIQSSQGAGVVYFTGGSPDHLLATLRDSELLRTLLAASADGAVLAGSSAGAMVMGSHMRRPRTGDWVEALGIVPGVAVLPHHESRDPAVVSRQLREQSPAGLTVLGIDARTGCLGRPGRWRVIGQGKVTVYRGSGWAVYGPGERLSGDV
jgi:cyanophycinase